MNIDQMFAAPPSIFLYRTYTHHPPAAALFSAFCLYRGENWVLFINSSIKMQYVTVSVPQEQLSFKSS